MGNNIVEIGSVSSAKALKNKEEKTKKFKGKLDRAMKETFLDAKNGSLPERRKLKRKPEGKSSSKLSSLYISLYPSALD